MKKRMIAVLILCLLVLAGCRATLETGPVPEEASIDWGITMMVENATPTGGTLVCTQTGGTATGELACGLSYLLQGLTEDGWRPVKKIKSFDIPAIACLLNDRTQTFKLDWAAEYRKLPAGTYRVGKDVTTRSTSGEWEKQYFYSEPFTIQ